MQMAGKCGVYLRAMLQCGGKQWWNVCAVKILCLGCWHMCLREYITYSRIPLIWQPLDLTGAGLSYIPDFHAVPPLT